jgi:hypothetical protein
MKIYGSLTFLLSLTMVGLGCAMLAITLARGGGSAGIVLGLLFVAAGAGRIYIQRRRL